MVYYKIVALDESELRNYLQTLVKNIKKYLVLQALYYNNCLLIYELISKDKCTFIFSARLMHGSHSNIAKNTLNYIKKSV
jgi:hypothetical protein